MQEHLRVVVADRFSLFAPKIKSPICCPLVDHLAFVPTNRQLKCAHKSPAQNSVTIFLPGQEWLSTEIGINRLKAITQSGAVAGKALVEHKYAYGRLLAEIRAERQVMLLHGLTEEQIAGIEKHRKLIREMTVFVPRLHLDDSLHHEFEFPSLTLPPAIRSIAI